MTVEVITCMYNEEFLAPFFLNHYRWVDQITVLYDRTSTDQTEAILRKGENVHLIPFTMPDGKLDDNLKAIKISQTYAKSTADWVIIVDADEFVFIGKEDLECIFKDFGLVQVALYDVYRHVSETDLDPTKPIKDQRSHGLSGDIKPSLARSGLPIYWGPGQHNTNGVVKPHPWIFSGAHWSNADLCFCIDRRIHGRKERISVANVGNCWGAQNFQITEAEIRELCKKHEHDPLIRWGINFGEGGG